jgi:hypothetical protein
VHDRRSDDDTALGVRKRVGALRDGNAVLLRALVLVDDVVLTANKDTRRTIEAVGGGILTSRDCGGSKVSSRRRRRGQGKRETHLGQEDSPEDPSAHSISAPRG